MVKLTNTDYSVLENFIGRIVKRIKRKLSNMIELFLTWSSKGNSIKIAGTCILESSTTFQRTKLINRDWTEVSDEYHRILQADQPCRETFLNLLS